MKHYLKHNGRTLIFAAAGVAWFALAMFTLAGCSTVSGLAKDLGAASEGLRQAMTSDE